MSVALAAERAELFGHPRGLATLFFTEMWERFSFYGMQALLVLFMTDQVRGGYGLSDQAATAIFGLYTAFVYLLSLPGGWIADRLWGARRAIFVVSARPLWIASATRSAASIRCRRSSCFVLA